MAKLFFLLCLTLLASSPGHQSLSPFPAHYNTAYPGVEDFHGSNSLLPKPYPVRIKHPILLPYSAEGRIFSFIFFAAFVTIKLEEIKIIFLHLNHRISEGLRLEVASGGQAGPSRVICPGTHPGQISPKMETTSLSILCQCSVTLTVYFTCWFHLV